MDDKIDRWVLRKTIHGEVYYDRNTGVSIRNYQNNEVSDNRNYWSLPTFELEAPLKVYFDFTYLCNLECRHCITNSSPRINRESELRTDRIEAIIDELASIGVLEVCIGGGEPLCHHDLFPILTYAYGLKLNVVITTNGTLVTPEIAKLFQELNIFEVHVSFDGSKPIHDNIRGAGCYQKALEAVSLLNNKGVKTIPRLTLCNDDRSGLDSFMKDLRSVGSTIIKVSLIESVGRGSLEKNKDLFKYARDETTVNLLLEIAQNNGLILKLPPDLAPAAELADRYELLENKKRCGAGLETAYISPKGAVQFCSATPNNIFGSVKTNSFMSVWTNNYAKVWRSREFCLNCPCLST